MPIRRRPARRLALDLGQVERALRGLLQRKCHLEQGLVAEATSRLDRLDQLAEGEIGVGKRGEGGLAYLP